MPCPHHNQGSTDTATGTEDEESDRGLNERSFKRAALTIGGASALSTAVGLYGLSGTGAADSERSVTIAERNNRQHAWDAYELYHEDKETSLPPESHLLLNVDYEGSGVPSAKHRNTVEMALDKLERAFGWDHEGLLFTIGYSPAYFERFGEDGYPLPRGLDPKSGAAKPGLLTPEGVIKAPGVTLDHEDPVAGDYDAVLHLSSDNPEHILAAEQALWEGRTVNGVEFDAPFDGIFTKPEDPPDRRVGFVGHDTVSENLEKRTEFDDSKIPDDAVLSMGFNDLFRNSVPRETNATMLEDQRLVLAKPPGAFAQGSIQHVSQSDINLDSNVGDDSGFDDIDGWYDDHDLEGRRKRMFSPEHTEENTGTVGEELGNSNAPGETPVRDLSTDTDLARRVDDHASEEGVVGHVEKLSRARFNLNQRLVDESNGGLPADDPVRREATGDERGEAYDEDLPGHDGTQEAEQVILRRDFAGVSNEKPGNHFVALMRFNPYMNYIRQAMNGVAFDSATFGLTGDARIQHDKLDVDPDDNGIANYLTTRRRANYVVPPITLRALPPAHAARPKMGVDSNPRDPAGETFEVVVGAGAEDYSDLYGDIGDSSAPGAAPGGEDWVPEDVAEKIDENSVRFGDHRAVNRGGGATPTDSSYDESNGELTLTFRVEDVAAAFRDDSIRARLFAKTDDRFPVFATVNLGS